LEGALRHVGADVTERTCMLVLTADAGSADVVGRLLEVGTRHDVALPCPHFMGAMEATILGQTPSAVIPVLIGGGCSVDALPLLDGSSARAALDILCRRGRKQDVLALSALIGARADVDFRNDVDAGNTAPDCAVRASNVRMVRMLLERGASVNAAGGDMRRTAPHWAAAALTPSVCMVLIAARDNPAALDSDERRRSKWRCRPRSASRARWAARGSAHRSESWPRRSARLRACAMLPRAPMAGTAQSDVVAARSVRRLEGGQRVTLWFRYPSCLPSSLRRTTACRSHECQLVWRLPLHTLR